MTIKKIYIGGWFQHPHTKRRAVVPFHQKDIPKGTLHAILKESGIDV